MNRLTVERKAKAFARELFGMELDIPIVFNGRLSRALGHVKFKTVGGKSVPYQLDLAKRLFQDYDQETIDGVIKHELCHWALCKQGKPYLDGDAYFENKLREIGAPSTMEIRYQGILHICVCGDCKKQVIARKTKGRVAKYTDPKYKSSCCQAPVVYAGTKVAN